MYLLYYDFLCIKIIINFSGFENTKLFGSTNTGLSQSDLSICSQGSVNPSYRYGNQLEYDAGHFGYSIYDSDSQSRKLEGSSKWVEFDKSPDIDKTLLTDYKIPSIEKDTSDNVRDLYFLIKRFQKSIFTYFQTQIICLHSRFLNFISFTRSLKVDKNRGMKK